MKTTSRMLALLLFFYAGTTLAETAAFKAELYACGKLTTLAAGGCADKVAKKVSGPFNFVIWNNQPYDVTTTWLRAKLDGESEWVELNKHTGNVPKGEGDANGANALVFQFNEQWLMDKMHAGDPSLKGGFKVRIKIKSAGLGSGRQAKCHPAQIKYDFANQRWLWRKDDNKANWHVIDDNQLYIWRTDGTQNDVKCGLKHVGGDKVEGE